MPVFLDLHGLAGLQYIVNAALLRHDALALDECGLGSSMSRLVRSSGVHTHCNHLCFGFKHIAYGVVVGNICEVGSELMRLHADEGFALRKHKLSPLMNSSRMYCTVIPLR